MTSPYNLRQNPKPSRKIIENSGDRDTQVDDNSRTITANSPTHTINTSTNTSEDEQSFHGFDPNIDIELAKHTQQNFARAVDEQVASYSMLPPEPATVTAEQQRPFTDQIPDTDSNQPRAASNDQSTSSRPQPPDLISQIRVMFESLENKVDSLEQNVNNKVDSLEQNVNNKVESIKTEIKAHCEVLDTKIEAISNIQNKLQSELNDIKETQQQQSTEIKYIESKLTNQMTENSYNLKLNLKADLDAHKTEINDTIQSRNKIVSDELNTTLNTSLHEIKIQLEESHKIQQKQLKNTLEENTLDIHNTLRPLIRANQSKIEENNATVENIKQTLDDHNQKIELLQNDTFSRPNNFSPNIYVTCGNNGNLDTNLPKFTGRTHNPREYLTKLHKYYDKTLTRQNPKIDAREHLIDTIESSLEGNASRWFSLIKEDVNTWEDFENKFLARFWNPHVQRGIKQRLENERYRPGGKLTRSEYFIERVITLKSITPSLTEDEIVTLLSEHFSELIQDARVVQNANTISAFESLLQREDIKDGNRKIRQNNPSPHTNTSPARHTEPRRNQSHYQNNNSKYRDNINPNAYQPRYDRDYRNNRLNQTNPQYNRQNPQHWPPLQQNRYPQNQNSPSGKYPERNEPRYPTNEQRQVCTTIVERTEPTHKPSTPPHNNKPHLNL